MTKSIFRIQVLHAGHGDCLWIEYGDVASPHRIVVDCGTAGTAERVIAMLDKIRDQPGKNELLVITHVDSDHIAGALPLISNPVNANLFSDVWFNGRRHLEPSDALEPFGAVQGERVTQSLLINKFPWNRSSESRSICLEEDGTPKRIKLPSGALLTILSPTWEKLRALQSKWDKEVKDAGLDPRTQAAAPVLATDGFEGFGFSVNSLADFPFTEDNTAPNGSSIAFLLEYKGKSMLLGADAHPSVLLSACKLLKEGRKVAVDLFKIPHHGSMNNTSTALLQIVSCKVAVFSSNGAYYGHPDKEAVARVIKYSPRGVELVFNCRSKFNDVWDSESLQKEWHYTTRYGTGDDGICVDLL